MRLLLGLVLTLTLAAGCAGDPDEPEASSSSASIGPEDTLPVLGAWQSQPTGRDEPLVLTLSDDNTYSVTDSCVELPGRWQLSQGRVVLTPKESENVLCEADREPPEVAEEYLVQGDRLVPQGEGPAFTR